MKIGGYVMVDCSGLDLASDVETTSAALYEEIKRAIESEKPVVFYGCEYGGEPLTPTFGFVYEDTDNIVVNLPNLVFSINSDGDISRSAPFSLLTGPSDAEGAVSEKVYFTVAASGKNLLYQWEYSQDSGVTWTNTTFVGYNTSRLQVTVSESRNGFQYRCVIKSEGSTIITNAGTLTVTE